MEEKLPPEVLDASIALGKLVLAFARVNRMTHFEDGERFESDTDHTVMLGLMATAFAHTYVSRLDAGKIAQFALVHDLVEAYAGDTPTFKVMSAQELEEKQAREAAALVRIRDEFDAVYPWIAETIDAYESLETPEARFVKVFDKVLPKILHVLNSGVTAKVLGHTKETVDEFHDNQVQKLSNGYGSDQPEVMSLLKELVELMRGIEL